MIESLQSRIAAHAAAAPAKLAEERARNRERYPEMARIFDDICKRFGKPKWFRITDNGRTVVEWKRG